MVHQDAKTLGVPQARRFIQSSLVDFRPDVAYDCVWVQWVIQFLKDDDLEDLLKRCRAGLAEGVT